MSYQDQQGSTSEAPRITVIGTGYLGATHAVCMAALGFEVLGFDVDPDKIASLSAGRVPFFEPGLPEQLEAALASGRLRFTTDLDAVAAFGDVHFICVGTPQQTGSNRADMRFVDAAATGLAARIDRRALIVGKSTVPVGTASRLAGLVRELSPAGDEVELAWNPEFLREGFAVEDTLNPDRLVFGVETPWAEHMLRQVYAPILDTGTPLVVADMATAELVKVAANSFLATKISFINAMAEVCETVGADVTTLACALGLDDRIGSRFLKPGLGFGGGCLPKDIRAFRARAEELGAGQAVRFLDEIDQINLRRRVRAVDVIRELAGGDLAGCRVAALGAAFKPNSDDVRDAPALDVARLLYLEGAEVVVYDPEATANAHRVYPDLDYVSSFAEAVTGADVVALLTEWDEFRFADPADMGALVASRRILDARNVLDASRYQAAGWDYRALGRPAVGMGMSHRENLEDSVA
ncbi:UDP-glucose/GDP-mannose dehydrogenase family protein [Salinibacterium sp. ZJ70]|uniref:UDP-glucose dehydrogenase family protein n=1 Tax=Salinibacterium sp. ZJ70 TaxID=2708084 RepID=UPI0014234826|nr:UDP-glucose/GDP-mannose dehydrogenase family protein [Salinibacterium sp. ZJ70]